MTDKELSEVEELCDALDLALSNRCEANKDVTDKLIRNLRQQLVDKFPDIMHKIHLDK